MSSSLERQEVQLQSSTDIWSELQRMETELKRAQEAFKRGEEEKETKEEETGSVDVEALRAR